MTLLNQKTVKREKKSKEVCCKTIIFLIEIFGIQNEFQLYVTT